ncbi:hypothetical protein BJ684DRAFT_20407 [Piptocephalis cylindrospora]|uniref:Mediator of RNA polymerase II transcription subunit 20 n=1 Tax=Piptocephalis cylindrospora TaxID=1907219 RepID=A0A4P9Y5K9_9FUNG|nr:hypothetical protein BJ684DRAFT_20407 [Piptocephalis cylindrospora]|eukprot:RKP13080.1 hypothetical protein BJ684DRAFT_20407 [Piptocephalis cylindrospora]
MGISTIVRWTSTDQVTPSLERLRNHLERDVGANSLGRWQLACRVYHPAKAGSGSGSMGPLYVVTSTEGTGRVWLVGRDGVVEGNRELEGVVHRLRSLWTVRQSASVEGWSYSIGDFILRVGSASVGTASKGIIMVVEYLPSVSLEAQLEGALLQGFLDLVLPKGSTTSGGWDAETDREAWESIGLGHSPWTGRHRGWQYVAFFQKQKML